MCRTLPLAILATSLGMPASADPVLDMMRGLSKDGPIYAYEMTYQEADILATGKIDPSQPET